MCVGCSPLAHSQVTVSSSLLAIITQQRMPPWVRHAPQIPLLIRRRRRHRNICPGSEGQPASYSYRIWPRQPENDTLALPVSAADAPINSERSHSGNYLEIKFSKFYLPRTTHRDGRRGARVLLHYPCHYRLDAIQLQRQPISSLNRVPSLHGRVLLGWWSWMDKRSAIYLLMGVK